jgi:hypothetical protein
MNLMNFLFFQYLIPDTHTFIKLCKLEIMIEILFCFPNAIKVFDFSKSNEVSVILIVIIDNFFVFDLLLYCTSNFI